MNNEYIIVSKTLLEKRIEELEKEIDNKKIDVEVQRLIKHELKQILSQSTPLTPEIEKAFDKGLESDMDYFIKLPSHEKLKQDYITNLKLNL